MAKKKLLYLSTNDGTDTRINKELRTLSINYEVLFLGVGKSTNSFLKEYCQFQYLIDGPRNHPLTLFKQILIFLRLLLRHRIHSIHVVNEQLMIFFWPFLFFKHTVLDVFDSIFLKWAIPKDKWLLLKRLVYAPCDWVIVTDENRRSLIPDFMQPRLQVLPNYPAQYNGPVRPSNSQDQLNVLFFGWLGMQRGGSIAKGLLEADERVRLIMLGWFSDEACKALTKHPRVDYRGVIPQQQALEIAATEADYILCLYEPLNLNTINASPNKIYDGIQTQTPLLINREVKVASMVENLNIGLVIPSYYPDDFATLAQFMIDNKGSFSFSPSLQNTYTWEKVEKILIEAHQR